MVRLGALAAPLWVSLLLLSACGGEKGQSCFDDRTCGVGKRCVFQPSGPGLCEACGDREIPYNGIDDDCNPRTPDLDLDGDGDNWNQSPVNPGTDCDDNDPTVHGNAREICANGKDDNCDGRIDEIECADEAPPMVRFVGPTASAGLAGQVPVVIEATDDVGVIRLELSANGAVVAQIDSAPVTSRRFEIPLDTTSLSDGPVTLRAVATDLLGRTGIAMVSVVVDNATPPEITLEEPVANRSYGGRMRVRFQAQDTSGVGLALVQVDGQEAARLEAPPFEAWVNTSSLAEGNHELRVIAVDVHGSQDSRTLLFRVDRSGPQIRFVAPLADDRVTGLLQVGIEAEDPAGLSQLASRGHESLTSPLNYAIDTTLLPNGALALVATARDATIVDGGERAGNTSTATVTVRVDNIDPRPVVNITEPLDAWGVFGVMSIAAQVSSPINVAITRVEFRVDGRLVGTDTQAPWQTNHDFGRHEGLLEVAVTAFDAQANTRTATVGVMVVEAPQFRVAPNYSVLGQLGNAGFAAADLDGDGVVDVVAGGSSISVLTGTITAAGRWTVLPARLIAADPVVDLALADADGDGDLDIIALQAGALRLYTNNAGTFLARPPVMIPGASLTTLAVGDLDGDGDPDAVAGGSVTGVVLHLANNVYTVSQTLGGTPSVTDVRLADVDLDGDLDIVVGRSGAGNNLITVFRNGGAGNFGAGQDSFTDAPPEQVRVTDVTGDNYPDVVALMPSINAYTVLAGNLATPGSFLPGPLFRTQRSPGGLAVGDVDGDGLRDVVVGASLANGVELWLNGATLFDFSAAYVVAQNLRRPLLVDVDGDGDLDLLAAGVQLGVIAFAENVGQGRLRAAVSYPFTEAPLAIASGNVVGGPQMDLVLAFNRNTTPPVQPPRVAFLAGQPDGFALLGLLPLPDSVSPVTEIAIGDLTGSGVPDIAFASSALPGTTQEPTAAVYRNLGGNQFSLSTLELQRPLAVAIGDVDGDGIGEVIYTIDPPGSAGDGAVVANLVTAVVRPVLAGEGPRAVMVGNIDSDPLGRLDFAVANGVTHDITVSVWGGTGFNSITYNAPLGLSSITLGMVNDDDLYDIVGIAAAGVFVMEGDRGFGFRSPVVTPAGPSPTRIRGGDFNGDGLFDVLVLNNDHRASLLLARPQGGFFAPLVIPLGNGPVDVTVGDFDGDGRPDIAVAQSGVAAVSIIYADGDRF